MSADLVKGLRGQLVKLATREEVGRLRADLTAEREARETLEKRLADLQDADAEAAMPHSIAKRRAARAAAMDLTL